MSVRRPIVSLSDSHMHMKRKNSVSQLGVKPNINLNDKCTLWQGCTTKLDIRCTPSFGSIFHAKGKFSHKNSAPQLTIESVMASFATWHSQALKGLNVFSSQKVEHNGAWNANFWGLIPTIWTLTSIECRAWHTWTTSYTRGVNVGDTR